MFRFRILSLVLLLIMAGCSQSVIRNGVDPLAFLSAGSEVQLSRDLDIPAGETRVFFQRGKAIPKSELDFYHPSCDLEVWELQHKVRKVSKDLFVIGRLTSGRESVVTRGAVKLADNNRTVRLFQDRGSSVHRFLRVQLHSSLQPDVMRLTCRGAWDDYYAARIPSEVEIKLALGNIMVFL